MNFSEFIKLYLIATPIFFALDMLWLGLLARNFYRSQLGSLLADKINWSAAILFYLFFIAGVIIFALIPAVREDSLQTALVFGALFGFFAYITYDLTNLATTKKWPFVLSVVDIVWGTTLSASVSVLTYLAYRWFN